MTEFNLPKHVGIIMDGNGRWAQKLGKERTYGHKVGANNVDTIVSHAFSNGIKVLTLYAFSAENWSRPKKEVDELMHLIYLYFKKFIGKVVKNNVKLNVIGDLSVLPEKLIKQINKCTEKCSENCENTLNIALNYGGRQEIAYAVNCLINENLEVNVENISSKLYTANCGEPDLIIRTGGELRLSNFLIFQGAYAELYFTNVLWPDFNDEEFDKALDDYSKRKRRFGNIN